MRLYIVVFTDTQKLGFISAKGSYESKEEAEAKVKDHALAFVKQDGGERQEKIAFQDEKTLEEIKNDNQLNTGLYLQNFEDDLGKKVYVYEKTIYDCGYLFNNLANEVKQVGIFSLTSIDVNMEKGYIDTTEDFSTQIKIEKPKQDEQMGPTFLGELATLINSKQGFNLKHVPVDERPLNIKDSEEY